MAYFLLMLFILLVALSAFALLGKSEKSGYSVVQFYARGKDAGFTFSEIELLRRAALKAELSDPSSLYWSVKQLDLCIKDYLLRARISGVEDSHEVQSFLAKLYAYRKKIEFDQPRYRKGIQSTRSISQEQRLRILLEGSGVFSSTVVRSTDRFLTVKKPSSTRIPVGSNWKGRRLSIYFWRQDDAGYVFDTLVLDDMMVHGGAILQLAHSDSLFRTQKRRSVRVKKQISAFLYLSRTGVVSESIEVDPGFRCIVEDLSEDGCAVTVGGKAPDRLKVKVQFELDGEPVVMPGEIRSSEFSAASNRSLLHIEALPLSLLTRNRILAEVFNIQPVEGLPPGTNFFDEEYDDSQADEILEPPAELNLDSILKKGFAPSSKSRNEAVQSPEGRNE